MRCGMNNKFKKAIAIMLCLSLLGGTLSALPSLSVTAADTPVGTPVSTVEEFLAMDPNGIYYLANDIDFSDKTYGRVLYPQTFKGVLDGNGHALLGITLVSSNSDAGIFANNFGGTLKNLTIGSKETPAKISSTGGGYSVACVAGTMSGNPTFENLTLYCEVRGDGKTAGFTSYIGSGKITIKNTSVYGSISGNPAAGFVTMSNDGSCDIEIRNSANHATVTAGNLSAGGFYTISAATNGGRMTNAVITGCVNYGAISATDWRVGGIVGEFNENKSATLTVDYCYNLGAITMKGGGGYAAGIVGGISFDAPNVKRSVSHCYNVGLVRNTGNAQRAYALVNADKNTANCTVTSCAYLEGNPTSNVSAKEIKQATDVASLLAIVSAYAENDQGNRFIADTGKLNEGGYPILAHQSVTHENLEEYACGRKVCLDCGAILSDEEEEKHTYVDNVIAPEGYRDGYLESECSACHHKTIRKGESSAYAVTPKDGVYAIGSAEGLIWYATNLAAGLVSGREKLTLTADIDLKDKAILPIGTQKNPFLGSFDGGYHTVKNLKLESEDTAALFGVIGMGASLENVGFADASVTAGGDAGVLVGTVVSGAVVKIARISIVNATVTAEKAAGALIGSTAYAADAMVNASVAQKVTVTGAMAGGLIGLGDNTTMKNCYVSATLSSKNNTTGSLAYASGRFNVTHSGYVRHQFSSVSQGNVITDKLLESGEIAYRINSYENKFTFGMENGAVVLSENPTRLVKNGAIDIYTDSTLATDKITLFAMKTDKGVSLAIALDRDANIKMTDYEIKVTSGSKSETVKFADLTLTRFMKVGNTTLTVDTVETILYTVTLEGVDTSATYQIGNLFSGAASVIE